MVLAMIHGNGNNEYVTVNDIKHLVTRYTYKDYVVLFAKNNVTHVACQLGLQGTDVGDGVHNVDDFLGAIAMFEEACGTQVTASA